MTAKTHRLKNAIIARCYEWDIFRVVCDFYGKNIDIPNDLVFAPPKVSINPNETFLV